MDFKLFVYLFKVYFQFLKIALSIKNFINLDFLKSIRYLLLHIRSIIYFLISKSMNQAIAFCFRVNCCRDNY